MVKLVAVKRTGYDSSPTVRECTNRRSQQRLTIATAQLSNEFWSVAWLCEHVEQERGDGTGIQGDKQLLNTHQLLPARTTSERVILVNAMIYTQRY